MPFHSVPTTFMILVALPVLSVFFFMFKRSADEKTEASSISSLEPTVLFEQYSSAQGYTSNYMDRLISFLKQKQVEATYKSSKKQLEVTSVNTDLIFYLYVSRGHEVRANNFVKRFRETENHGAERAN